MPDIKVPTVDMEKAAAELNKALKESAYIAVGLGVLGFQRAQVQRVELTKQLEAQKVQLSGLAKSIEEVLAPVREQLTKVDLREPMSTASDLIETQVQAFRAQLSEFVKVVDDRVSPARQQVDEQIDKLEERLPEAARSVVKTVRSAAATQEHALRSAVGL